MKLVLCAVVHKNTGELELISGDRLHDLAPATDRVENIPTPPTPDEQKQVENWLKVKVQLPLINAENQCRQRELQIRQDYLQQAMESAIKDAQRTQMKLAAKVAGGDETYRGRGIRRRTKSALSKNATRISFKNSTISKLFVLGECPIWGRHWFVLPPSRWLVLGCEMTQK
jgi:hypothetical protein